MEPATGALVSAAALAAGAYLNAKLAISVDIQQLRNERAWGERFQSRIASLGDSCSTYHIFDRVDPGLEFLWFEGKSWTYGEIKSCELFSWIVNVYMGLIYIQMSTDWLLFWSRKGSPRRIIWPAS